MLFVESISSSIVFDKLFTETVQTITWRGGKEVSILTKGLYKFSVVHFPLVVLTTELSEISTDVRIIIKTAQMTIGGNHF